MSYAFFEQYACFRGDYFSRLDGHFTANSSLLKLPTEPESPTPPFTIDDLSAIVSGSGNRGPTLWVPENVVHLPLMILGRGISNSPLTESLGEFRPNKAITANPSKYPNRCWVVPKVCKQWQELEVAMMKFVKAASTLVPVDTSSDLLPSRFEYWKMYEHRRDVRDRVDKALVAFRLLCARVSWAWLSLEHRGAQKSNSDWRSTLVAASLLHHQDITSIEQSVCLDWSLSRVGGVICVARFHTRTVDTYSLVCEVHVLFCWGRDPSIHTSAHRPPQTVISRLGSSSWERGANRPICQTSDWGTVFYTGWGSDFTNTWTVTSGDRNPPIADWNTATIATEPALPPSAPPAFTVPRGSQQRPGESFKDYFQRLDEVNARRAENEDIGSTSKKSRLDREANAQGQKCPGRSGATVFVWIEDENGFRIRTPAGRPYEDTWAYYASTCRKYNSWNNEWDLCSLFDPGAVPPDEYDDGDEEDHDDDGHDNENSGGPQAEGNIVPIHTSSNALSTEEGSRSHSDHSPKPTAGRSITEQASFTLPAAPSNLDMVSARPPSPMNLDSNNANLQLFPDHALSPVALAFNRYGLLAPLPSTDPTLSINLRHLGHGQFDVTPWGTTDEHLQVQLQMNMLQRVARDKTLSPCTAVDFEDKTSTLYSQLGVYINVECHEVSRWDEQSKSRKWTPVFILTPVKHSNLVLRLDSALDVMQVFHCGWDAHGLGYIAEQLVARGAPFIPCITSPADVPPSVASIYDRPIGLGYQPEGYHPDALDLASYKKALEIFLHGPHGYLALHHGGLVTRIARDIISFDASLLIPELYSRSRVFEVGQTNHWYDALSEDEVELICGVYHVYTGAVSIFAGAQTSSNSWWPSPNIWNKTFLSLGFWSKDAEAWYIRRRNLELQAVTETSDSRLPTAGDWRKKLISTHRIIAQTYRDIYRYAHEVFIRNAGI